MTAFIAERYDSRSTRDGEDPQLDLTFVVRGTDDEEEVNNLVFLNSPSVYGDLELTTVTCEPQGGDLWYATSVYRQRDLDGDYEFTTAGGTQRIGTSLATEQRVAAQGFVAPDYQGAINVNEGRVEGVDITVPVFTFSETYSLPSSTVTPAYKHVLFQMTGRVNNASFREYAKGEVLFLGASGHKRGRERWQVTFQFAASPNIVNEPLGSGGLTVSKEGWQHLWVRYEDEIDSNRLVKIPAAYYVEQVYFYGNFVVLGI